MEQSSQRKGFLQLTTADFKFFADTLAKTFREVLEKDSRIFQTQLIHSLINTCFYKLAPLSGKGINFAMTDPYISK